MDRTRPINRDLQLNQDSETVLLPSLTSAKALIAYLMLFLSFWCGAFAQNLSATRERSLLDIQNRGNSENITNLSKDRGSKFLDDIQMANRKYKLLDVKGALDELKAAEELADNSDEGEQIALFQEYCDEHYFKAALKHCQVFLSLLKSRHTAPNEIEITSRQCDVLSSMGYINFLRGTKPSLFSTQELNSRLRLLLSEKCPSLPTNPMAWTLSMKKWANSIKEQGTNNMQRAEILFEAMNHRFSGTGPVVEHTAEEGFSSWQDPNTSFYCQDYAFLYVALARTMGLDAFFCFVKEDCFGAKDWHACAALFPDASRQVILVDPSIGWYGVPHKNFDILDDLQATAFYLSYTKNNAETAYKIAPELLPVESTYFNHLVAEDRWSEATNVFAIIKQNDEFGWVQNLSEAELLAHNSNWNGAAERLVKAIKINPSQGPIHMELAQIRSRQGKLAECRNELENALNCVLSLQQKECVESNLHNLDVMAVPSEPSVSNGRQH